MPSRTDDPRGAGRGLDLPGAPAGSELSASPAPSRALEAAEDDELTRESYRAIFSSHQRAGRFEAADEIEVLAVCGEVTLDFTRAELPPSGVIEIVARAICGEIKIIVPDGAEVDLDGTPVLGSIEQQMRRKGAREAIREWVTGEREEDLAPSRTEPPCFHIDARAIIGSVKVTGR